MTDEPADAGGLRVYANYIAEQLVLQDARKESLESRGITIITTSGAFATVLLGLASFARGSRTLDLSEAAERPLRAALIAFLVAGLLALLANAPLLYRRPEEDKLEAAITDAGEDDEFYALAAVSYNRLSAFTWAARVNGWKALALALAMGAEIVAIGAIAWTVWLVF